jgi:hypothetical protein
MNAAHLHLITNHLPAIGAGFTFLVLLVGIWFKSGAVQKTALAFFVLVALLSVPVYLSGKSAEDLVERLPGVSHDAIEAHEEAAVIALTGMEVLGVLALLGFAFFGRRERLPERFLIAIVGWTLVTLILAARTSNLGGKIRHPEEMGGAFSSDVLPPEKED